jgi:hypothetical protein
MTEQYLSGVEEDQGTSSGRYHRKIRKIGKEIHRKIKKIGREIHREIREAARRRGRRPRRTARCHPTDESPA